MRLLCTLFMAVACLAGDPASGPLRERVDLNNAPRDVIEKLPGVGPKLAQEIIAGRPYKTIDELDHVKGIGAKKLEQLRPRVFIVPMRAPLPVRSSTPIPAAATNRLERVNINTASQKDLEKLPGVGPKRAVESGPQARRRNHQASPLRPPGRFNENTRPETRAVRKD
jgi:DNA uptake protein ComE-like DNA-binding protein